MITIPENESQILTPEMIHEIKNPLSVILSNSEFLSEKVAQKDFCPSTFTEGLGRIRNTALRISKIISTLQKFSDQRTQLDFEEINLFSLIEDACLMISERCAKHGVSVHRHNEAPNARIMGNPVLLSQAFLNLLINSIDALEGAERKAIHIRVHAHLQQCIIQFVDYGCGFSDENVNKVATKYFTTKPPGKGTGLGLHLVNSIITKHQGQFKITNAKDPTVFSITLNRIDKDRT